MFNFRNTTLIFFVFLLLLNILKIAGIDVHFWAFLILTGIYLFVSVLLSFFIRSGFHLDAYCRGNTKEKVVALTFDDGPDVEFTQRILDELKNNSMTATFFCVGRKVDGNEELLRRMQEEGHLIGTHSYSHSSWFDFFSSARMKKEFLKTEEKIIRITGRRPLLFRPPYGVINPMVKKAVQATPYHIIGFSNRPFDTVSRSDHKVLVRIVRRIQPGDIILLHDTVQQNILVLKSLSDWIKANGYQVISLDKLLNIEPYEAK